jgi:hypothetical protein
VSVSKSVEESDSQEVTDSQSVDIDQSVSQSDQSVSPQLVTVTESAFVAGSDSDSPGSNSHGQSTGLADSVQSVTQSVTE